MSRLHSNSCNWSNRKDFMYIWIAVWQSLRFQSCCKHTRPVASINWLTSCKIHRQLFCIYSPLPILNQLSSIQVYSFIHVYRRNLPVFIIIKLYPSILIIVYTQNQAWSKLLFIFFFDNLQKNTWKTRLLWFFTFG